MLTSNVSKLDGRMSPSEAVPLDEPGISRCSFGLGSSEDSQRAGHAVLRRESLIQSRETMTFQLNPMLTR